MTIQVFTQWVCVSVGALVIISGALFLAFFMLSKALHFACICWDSLMSLMMGDEMRRRIMRLVRKQFHENNPKNAEVCGLREGIRWYFENREKVTRP